jgi:hypothetical protein
MTTAEASETSTPEEVLAAVNQATSSLSAPTETVKQLVWCWLLHQHGVLSGSEFGDAKENLLLALKPAAPAPPPPRATP